MTSNTGSPKAMSGIIRGSNIEPLAAPATERAEVMKPKRYAPESPMNMLAGKTLYLKKAKSPPIMADVRTKTFLISITSWVLGVTNLTASNVPRAMKTIPPANPSTPSTRLTVFVNPTTHNNVNGYVKRPRATKPFPFIKLVTNSIFMLYLNKIKHAIS